MIGWAALFHNARSLSDLQDLPIGSLMRESGLTEIAAVVPLDEAAEAVVRSLQVGSIFEEFFRSLDSRRQVIARRRTFAADPEVLDELASDFGVSRERVRQLESDVSKAFSDYAGTQFMQTSIWLRQTFPMVLPAKRLEMILDRLVEYASPDLRTSAKVALLQHIGYEKAGDVWVGREFEQIANRGREVLANFTDKHGIVDEQRLRETLEIEDDEVWPVIVDAVGLKRVLDQLLVRDTRVARLILALRALGGPATREQLSEVTGLEVRSLAAVLSSDDSFIRITKDTWGLSGWTDDPYDGVVREIIQRINAGHGQANYDELLAEIPERFGVSAGTVKAYLATPKFVVDGEVVRLSEITDVEAPPLSALREILWTEDGQPVLRLTVTEHYLGGLSIKIPPAVALHLGVGPDAGEIFPISHPIGCQDVSVIWRAHSPSGPEIGRLREALLAIGATAGAEVFVVLDSSGLVITADGAGFLGRRPTPGSDAARSGSEIPETPISPAIERMKARRRFWDHGPRS